MDQHEKKYEKNMVPEMGDMRDISYEINMKEMQINRGEVPSTSRISEIMFTD